MLRRLLLAIGLNLVVFGPGAHAEVIDIDSRQLGELLARGVPLVDVRTPGEWRQTGVVEGSHLLMFFDERGRYDASQWLADLGEIAKPAEPVILICRTGRRTTQIAAFLYRQVGYANVYHVRLGLKGWVADGGKTTPATVSPTRH